MPCQGAGGRGGCQRSAPTGGAAYGMPRNSSVAATAWPRTVPSAVATTEGVSGFVLALVLLPAPGGAVALVHAAAAISTAVAAAPAASPVRTRCPIGIARIARSPGSRQKRLTL